MKKILIFKHLALATTAKSLVIALLLSLSIQTINAQNSGENITLSVKNQTIESVLNTLRNEYNYSFIFKNEDLDTQKRVSVDANNMPIEELLTSILRGGGN